MLIIIFLIIVLSFHKRAVSHKVLKVISSNEFYIDFNDNITADADELVILDDIDIEPDSLSKTDTARLNYLGNKYAQTTLLNKYVTYKNGWIAGKLRSQNID